MLTKKLKQMRQCMQNNLNGLPRLDSIMSSAWIAAEASIGGNEAEKQ